MPVRDIVIIGRGTSTATYLRTLEGAKDLDIVVIGKANPWSGARGYSRTNYTKNINQALQLVNYGMGNLALRDQTPVDRVGFAGATDLIITYFARTVIDAEVRSVDTVDFLGRTYYRIQTANPRHDIYASKVVVAAGAGIEENAREYHVVPPFVGDLHRRYPRIVMDLDVFQNNTAFNGNGNRRIAVFGANAGTDAIMEAATRNFSLANVYWMLRPTDNPGVALTWDVTEAGIVPTFSATQAGANRPTGTVYRYKGDPVLMITDTNRVEIICDTPGGQQSVEVDYLVYAMGQRGNMQQGSHSGFVPRELIEKLEPIYDIDQRFGDEGAWSHVVGVQMEGTTKLRGMEVIGSAATQIGRNVRHNFLDRDFQDAQRECLEVKFLASYINTFFPELAETGLRSFTAMIQISSRFAGQIPTYERKQIALRSALQSARMFPKSMVSLANNLAYLFIQRAKAAVYYARMASNDEDTRVSSLLNLDRQGANLPATIGDNRLIGGLQRNIGVVNGHMNYSHVRNGINFMEDKTTIALHIAVNYPNIPPKKANAVVNTIVSQRGSRLRGFSPGEIQLIENRLAQLNLQRG